MSQKFLLPRGTADQLPDSVPAWQKLEQNARSLLNLYGYKEIRTPFFEETELFARSMGQTSDVVQKQMLNLASQKEGETLSGLSLRPEGTASVVRSYIQNSLDRVEPLSKLYYIGPMFRGERPQKGRLRQFNQIGAEVIGPDTASPYLDAEIIALAVNILKELGLKTFELRINTLGSQQDKNQFSKWLREQIKPYVSKLTEECQSRYEQNVFRILDSKDKASREIVDKIIIDQSFLSKESREYYRQVKQALGQAGVKYKEDPRLVRGLDYYTHTVFEISNATLGSQDAVGAGGRYGPLVKQLGGPEVDAMGFALGIERILLAGEFSAEAPGLDVFVIPLDEKTLEYSFELLARVRQELNEYAKKNKITGDFSADMSYRIASMKSQMRQANKANARFVVLVGEDEVKAGKVTVKNMASGDQAQINRKDIKSLVEMIAKERT